MRVLNTLKLYFDTYMPVGRIVSPAFAASWGEVKGRFADEVNPIMANTIAQLRKAEYFVTGTPEAATAKQMAMQGAAAALRVKVRLVAVESRRLIPPLGQMVPCQQFFSLSAKTDLGELAAVLTLVSSELFRNIIRDSLRFRLGLRDFLFYRISHFRYSS